MGCCCSCCCNSNGSIGTNPESHIVRCPVLNYNHECCSLDVLQFDTSVAKNHPGLINLIGDGIQYRWNPEVSKIDKKFDELEMKLKSFQTSFQKPGLVIFILMLIPFVNLLIIPLFLYGLYYKSKKFDEVIQAHFEDWKVLGIQTKYVRSRHGNDKQHRTRRIKEGTRDPSREDCIAFILPFSMA